MRAIGVALGAALVGTGALAVWGAQAQVAAPGGLFTDVTASSGITFHRQLAQGPFWLFNMAEGGVAVGDVDGDGWEDLYFTNANPFPAHGLPEPLRSMVAKPNALYRSNGDGTFADITAMANVGGYGIAHGAVFVDYDNDRDQDLLVANWGGVQLFSNDGDGTFTDMSGEAGLEVAVPPCAEQQTKCWYTSIAVADADDDGFLDVYVTAYQVWVWFLADVRPDAVRQAPNLFFHNDGDGTFTEMAAGAGIADPYGWGWSAAWADHDRDGDMDLMVANDFTPDKLFRNDGGLRFTDVTQEAGFVFTGNSMGSVWFDVDRDGDLDAVTSEMMPPAVFRNLGGSFEVLHGDQIGLGNPHMFFQWGIVPLDADLDGDEDLFVTHGAAQFNDGTHTSDTTDKGNFYYEADGRGLFRDRSRAAGVEDVFVSGRGAARLDFDHDGDDDVVVASATGGTPVLFRNDSPRAGAPLRLRLEGGPSNLDAVGAEVLVTSSKGPQLRQVAAGDSFESGQSRWLTFALGPGDSADVLVRWPSGGTQRFGLPAGTWVVREGDGAAVGGAAGPAASGEARFALDSRALAREGAHVVLALEQGRLVPGVVTHPLPVGIVRDADACATTPALPRCESLLPMKEMFPFGLGISGASAALAPGGVMASTVAFEDGGTLSLRCAFGDGGVHLAQRAPANGACRWSMEGTLAGPWRVNGYQEGMQGAEAHFAYGSPYM